MSRKDFQALADELAASKPATKGKALDQWKKDVRGIATACARSNARFDISRFLSACDFPPE